MKEGQGPPSALYATARWLIGQGRYADAATTVRAMVRAAPEDEIGWLTLGVCHEAIGQVEIALEMYGVGRVIAAPAPRCELARARALRGLSRHVESVEAYASAAGAAERAGDEELGKLIEEERVQSCS